MPEFIRVTIDRTPIAGWVTLHDAVDKADIRPGDVVFASGSFNRMPNGSLFPTTDAGDTEYKGFLYLNAQRLYVPIPDDRVFDVAQALERAKRERMNGFLAEVPDDVFEHAPKHDGKIARLGVVSRLPYQLLLKAERIGFESAIEAILEHAKKERK